jgi:hypothetical protein
MWRRVGESIVGCGGCGVGWEGVGFEKRGEAPEEMVCRWLGEYLVLDYPSSTL